MAEKHPKRKSADKALANWNNEGGAPASGDLSTRTHPKRPRKLKQGPKRMVDSAQDEIDNRELRVPRTARADSLPSARRQQIARNAAMGRWTADRS
jgi:hypothetical protein